jgi:hypothetical protein
MEAMETNVSVKLEPFTSIVRRTSQPGLSAINWKIRVPALFQTENDGDISGAHVAFAVDYRVDGGVWINAVTMQLYGKTMSPYEYGQRMELPPSTDFIDVRLTRIEGVDSVVSNDIYWSTFTEIIDGALAATALVGMAVDSRALRRCQALWIDGLIVKSRGTTTASVTPGRRLGRHLPGWLDQQSGVGALRAADQRAWGLGRDIDAQAVDRRFTTRHGRRSRARWQAWSPTQLRHQHQQDAWVR